MIVQKERTYGLLANAAMKPYLQPEQIAMIDTYHKSGCLRDSQLY